MAEDLDDGEFWLPSEFLADDAFMEKDLSAGGSPLVEEKDLSCFPCEFPYDSAVSSPVESVTETESDEEDLVAGLARQMGSSAFAFENPKTRVMAGSPQSTLCSFGGRSRASSNDPSLVSSPPSPLESKNDDAWDLLYEAAGQVVRLRMNEESAMVNQQVHCRGLLCPPRNPSPPPPPPPPPPAKTANLGLHLDQAFARRQLQAQQFHQLKKQQLLKQQQSLNAWGRQQGKVTPPAPQQQMLTRPRGGGCGGYAGGRGGGRPPGLSSSAWPPLNSHAPPPVQPGSGMRAVFLAGSGSRKESGGTGVFLPRRAGSPAELRKKPACSTVLLPARVVQALNLNLDDMAAQPRFPGAFVLDHEAILARNQSLNKRSLRPQPPPPLPTNHEIRLPQDWTY